MKNTFIQEEGIDYSTRHDFGDPRDSFSDYHYLMKYEVGTPIDDIVEILYYTITEDNYIQIVADCQYYDKDGNLEEPNNTPSVIAQFKRNEIDQKSQILVILEKYYDSLRYYIGFPKEYIDGIFFTNDEFNSFLQAISNKYKNNAKVACLAEKPELAVTMDKYKLDPLPDGRDTITWLAICPRCRRHLLRFQYGKNNWGCGYCNLNGHGTEEFEEKIAQMKAVQAYKEELIRMKPLGRQLTSDEIVRMNR